MSSIDVKEIEEIKEDAKRLGRPDTDILRLQLHDYYWDAPRELSLYHKLIIEDNDSDGFKLTKKGLSFIKTYRNYKVISKQDHTTSQLCHYLKIVAYYNKRT